MTPETKGRLEKSSFEGFPVIGRRRPHAKTGVRQRLYAQRLSNITKNGVFDVKYTCIVHRIFDEKMIYMHIYILCANRKRTNTNLLLIEYDVSVYGLPQVCTA